MKKMLIKVETKYFLTVGKDHPEFVLTHELDVTGIKKY
jgi:hypothetical protein